MEHVSLLEAQKAREADWVNDGAEAFLKRLEAHDPTMTPMGRGIIKAASDRFQERLRAYVTDLVTTPRPMQSPTFQIIMLLGVPHVAAVALRIACTIGVGSRVGSVTTQTALVAANTVAEALESDLRFRVWRQGAKGAEKRAVDRMRERMKGDPKTWRSRARQLRSKAEIPWSREDVAVVGMDLLGMLVESCPDVFTADTVHHGHKTLKLFDLTHDTRVRLLEDTQAAAASHHTRFGMMLVPPRPWRYAE